VRGPGELLGARQSGADAALADLVADVDLPEKRATRRTRCAMRAAVAQRHLQRWLAVAGICV
jgi:RecG-like helicase